MRLDEISPQDMTTDEVVEMRKRVRWKIRILEQWSVRTDDEAEELRRLRRYLQALMREAGNRFIQPRLL